MATDFAENLRDTFPGRLLICWHLDWCAQHPEAASAQQYADSLTAQDYSGRAGMTLSMYMYGDDFKEVADLDTSDPEVVAMSEAIATSLRAPERDTLHSPQVHHGRISAIRTPTVDNHRYPCALPEGAFWSAPLFDGGEDAWRLHGEHDDKRSPERYEIHFDPVSARIARIDSYDSWYALVCTHPLPRNGTLLPDWRSIAKEWDAVHVTISGLLCAQPRVSLIPWREPMDGEAHSRSGPIVGVGAWSTTSTAWLRNPDRFTVRTTRPQDS